MSAILEARLEMSQGHKIVTFETTLVRLKVEL
jgi:hypothetical protein